MDCCTQTRLNAWNLRLFLITVIETLLSNLSAGLFLVICLINKLITFEIKINLFTWMFNPLHTKIGQGAGLPHSRLAVKNKYC